MIEIDTNRNLETEVNTLKELLPKLNVGDEEESIETYQRNKINMLLSDPALKNICKNISTQKYLEGLSYTQLVGILEILVSFVRNLKDEKDKIDIKIFFDRNKVINLRKLKAKFKLLGCDKNFPNFNFQRFKELLETPPKEILPQDGSSKETIKIDNIVFRKFAYGILQMVINEMDLVSIYTGGEGMGKSKECSQHMSILHWFLTEVGLINYEYNINDMWFNTVQAFNEAEDKYFDQRFRILGLDEGNELNSQDWQDETVKTFFQRLRRERERQRIKLIAIPQLVELLKGVAISRANFIFYSESKDDIETGTLDKGYTNFYIVPRNKIYSYYNKKILNRDDIITILTNHLKDKNTGYKKIPNSILIKRYKSNFVWGFDRDVYKKNLKETNKTYSVSKGLKVTEQVAYYLYKFMPPMKEFGFDRDSKVIHSKAYSSLQKLRKSVMNYFDDAPEKKMKWDTIYKEYEEKGMDKLEELRNK